jgi:hypothetical protein
MGLSDKPWFRKFLLTLVSKKLYKKFIDQTKSPFAAQEVLLKSIIENNKDTAFGKDHNFDRINTFEDYIKNVPIRDFEGHRPYIDRIINGEENILFPGRPLMYNMTSGTTSKPKMIPISNEYFETSISELSKIWLYSCLIDNPNIYDGKSLSAVSPAVDGYEKDGTPFGNISGVTLKNIPKVLKSTFSCPYSFICIKDYKKKYYAIMRAAVEVNITIIISPSVSNIERFHESFMTNFSDMIKDIREGTLRKDVLAEISEEDKDEAINFFKPNPKRAKELEDLMAAHKEKLRPKHYWPNVGCINIWVQGNFTLLLPKIADYFTEKTAKRAFGYQTSEGRIGMVLGNDWDYSVFALHAYLLEFIEEKEKEQKNPKIYKLHELQQGKRYFIIFTNGSGLFRYDINDIIEICGFYNDTPIFKFIQKGEGVTSITGEKLTEQQVIEGIKKTSDDLGVKVEFYNMFCDLKGHSYKLFIEYEEKTKKDKKAKFLESFDSILKTFNPEYEAKRGSGRLDAPEIYELQSGAYEKLKSSLVAKGVAKDGQYKDMYLSKKPDILEELKTLKK